MAQKATTSGSSVSSSKKAKQTLGEVYAVTAYNGRNRLPTSGIDAVKRDKKEDMQPSTPIIQQAGWMHGTAIAHLLEYTGCKAQLVETEQGGKFEFFLRPDNPEADNWLSDDQTERVLNSLSRQNVGVVAAFENPQGLMLVLTPLANLIAGEPTNIELTVDGDAVVLAGPVEE